MIGQDGADGLTAASISDTSSLSGGVGADDGSGGGAGGGGAIIKGTAASSNSGSITGGNGGAGGFGSASGRSLVDPFTLVKLRYWSVRSRCRNRR
jgi:hypothetical protein